MCWRFQIRFLPGSEIRVANSMFRPHRKKIFGPLAGADRLKILDAKLTIMTLSCTVSWAWSESFDLYSRQMVLPPRNTELMQHSRAPSPLTDGWAPIIFNPVSPPPPSRRHSQKRSFYRVHISSKPCLSACTGSYTSASKVAGTWR